MSPTNLNDAPATEPMKLANVEDIYLMSPMQQGILFHCLFEPQTGMYCLELSCQIEAALDVPAFRRAWEEVIRRHSTLRTAFLWEGLDRPMQVVRKVVELPFREEDWRGLEQAEQQSKWQRFLLEERQRGFDFKEAPVLRMVLVRTGEQRYYFVWHSHHMVLDGWCLQIVLGEAFTLYAAYRERRGGQLRSPRLYRDYIQWLQKQDEKKAEAFWRGELKGLTGPTRLGIEQGENRGPQERGGGQGGEEEYGTLQVSLQREVSGQLEGAARRQQITSSTIVQSAWAIVLSRYSGEGEVVYGATVSGRSGGRGAFENTVGLFINTLPMRVRVREEERVSVCQGRIQQRQAQGLDYEYSPLPKVQEWSEVPRGTPLFESIFVFENFPVNAAIREWSGAGLKFSEVATVEINNYPLALVIRPGGELEFICHYNRRLYERRSVERVLEQLGAVLEQVVKDGEVRIGEVSLLRAGERQQLVEEGAGVWRGRRPEGESGESLIGESLIRLVAAHAEDRPEAVAVIAEGREWSYGELEREANQWAHYLKRWGVEVGTRVGVCVEQGGYGVVACLGILKCGGVIVGMDGGEGRERLGQMAASSGSRLVITEKQYAGLFSSLGMSLVVVEEAVGAIGKESEARVEAGGAEAGESVACVLYRSSGSGPVGVMIPQRSLGVKVLGEELGIGGSGRVGQTWSFGKEGASLEMLRVLGVGGCVVQIGSRVRQAPRQLAGVLREQGVTVLWAGGVAIEQLAGEFPWALKNVRRIIAEEGREGVERLRGRISGEVAERVYGVEGAEEGGGWWRMYGVGNGKNGSGKGGGIGAVGVGQLREGSRMYLLDRQMEPVPEGVVGEIYIGGGSVAQGYEGEAGMTATAFVPDPFSEEVGARLYRSGERGRRHGDGSVEGCGREDGRVMVKGVRVAVEEVERVLGGHAGVREAVVVMREELEAVVVRKREAKEAKEEGGEKEGARGEKERGVGAGEGSGGMLGGVSGEELRRYVQERLPGVMVPARVKWVEDLVGSGAGGVDRRGLVRWLGIKEAAGVAAEYEAPRTEVERILTEVWQGVLNRGQVGIHDNFFKLGGDSILSIQVIARARQGGVELSPRQLFENQTIAELAEVAGRGVAIEAEQGMVSGAVPLTPFQEVFFEWGLARPEHFNQAVLLELAWEAETELVEKAVEGLLRQHDALRMRYRKSGAGWEQWCEAEIPGGVYERRKLEAQQLEEDAERVQGGLDLEGGRLVKVVEYEMVGRKERRLLLVIHHLVVDGVSWRILLEDLERGYEQLKKGEAVELGSKTTSFQQWGKRLAEYAQEGGVKGEMEYWVREEKKRVKGLALDTGLGLDGEGGGGGGENGSGSGSGSGSGRRGERNLVGGQRNVVVELEEEETRVLLQEVPEAYNTQINDVLLTALGRGLEEWSGGEGLLVDVEGHGREEVFAEVDVSRTVGWFSSTYPLLLRGREGRGWDPGQALSTVKEQLRGVPNRGLGYGLLRYLNGEEEVWKRLGEMPKAEIIFNYLGQVDQVLRGSRLFAPARESSGYSSARQNRRAYVLDVNAVVMQGRLQVNWGYSEGLHRQSTIERMAGRFLDSLRELIAHCTSEEAGGFTPSDFVADDMTQDDLLQIASLLDE